MKKNLLLLPFLTLSVAVKKIVVLYAIIVINECEISIRSACHFLAISLTTLAGLLPSVFDRVFETLIWAMCFGVMETALLTFLVIDSMYFLLGNVRS